MVKSKYRQDKGLVVVIKLPATGLLILKISKLIIENDSKVMRDQETTFSLIQSRNFPTQLGYFFGTVSPI